MSAGLAALQKRLQYQFADASLLALATTHRSFSADHNERLEFLGDSVLGVCVADLLYKRLGSLPEGDLSRVRAGLVRQEALHPLAVKLGLSEVIRLGEGEMRSGGQKRPSILADALEAVIGATYLDGGFAAAQALVNRLYASLDINPAMAAMGKDPKTELQEWLQARRLKVPGYKVVATLGAAHKQTFEVECEIAELNLTARGTGGSRRAGEQAAATTMLQTLKTKGSP
ncbi:ribonuclease III [Rhodoferax sp.]|uniref:ribonuclease III n=1 Tax=Rhodoferax sp. TaxID=50421 RepID=UPI00284DBDDA|nr:ribonuclease III [Rhodoferax sp.]MDR3370556.1 ribonuclease III [Rhodoferax sp.]